MDSVRHETLLSCLKSKSPNLKVDSIFQFVKRDYNIYLRGVNKVFTLWDDNKRVWYQDGDVWLTKPRVITSAITAGDDSVVYHSTEKVDIPNDFSELNRFNPNSDGYQLIANAVEINVYKHDIHITLLAHSHRWDLLYYCIMGKLALKYSPTFIKINVITQDKRVYTLTKYIYNPLVRFQHTYPSFMQ